MKSCVWKERGQSGRRDSGMGFRGTPGTCRGGSLVWCGSGGLIPGHRANVRFSLRPCTLRCSPQCRKSPILLSLWPVLPGLKPPSWDTRYLEIRGESRGEGGRGYLAQLTPTRSNALPQVSQMAQYFEPLTLAAVGAASKTLSHPQQMALLDQTKTLAESALQLLYTAKEAGGNPKVVRAGRRGCY